MPDDLDRLAAILHIRLDGLIDLVDAAKLIPMRQGTLRMWLLRHKADFPARYRRSQHRQKRRLLTADEIRLIRMRIAA